MDLDTISITITTNLMDFDDTKCSKESLERSKQDEKLAIEDAKIQILDYIRTFKRLPNKKVYFMIYDLDDYHVVYHALDTKKNTIHCSIKFE